jgi:small subunit ribosomal protein S6
MLDPEVPDERRDEIASNARKRIESAGGLKHDESWGMRKLAYDIQQRTEADYRFYRFEAERPLLDDLDHTLKITDGVLRFRIFRVDPRSPLISPPDPAAIAARRRDGRRDDGPRDDEGGQYEEFVAGEGALETGEAAAPPAEAEAEPAAPVAEAAEDEGAEPAPAEPEAEPAPAEPESA